MVGRINWWKFFSMVHGLQLASQLKAFTSSNVNDIFIILEFLLECIWWWILKSFHYHSHIPCTLFIYMTPVRVFSYTNLLILFCHFTLMSLVCWINSRIFWRVSMWYLHKKSKMFVETFCKYFDKKSKVLFL